MQRCFYSDIAAVEGPFDVKDIRADVFRCSHDARECLGYRFSDGKESVACVTDTGIATLRLVDFLAPCKSIMLESNHDSEMLQHGAYPYLLKRRIASELGHLSNRQASPRFGKTYRFKCQKRGAGTPFTAKQHQTVGNGLRRGHVF